MISERGSQGTGRSRKNRRIRSLTVRAFLPTLAVVLAGVAPGPASAALPAAPAGLEIASNRIVFVDGTDYPLNPYTSGGWYTFDRPYYVFRGTADPGVEIAVTVTDAFGSSPVTATTTADNVGEWFVSPNVTNLGLHGTVSSVLTFTAVARNAEGEASASIPAVKIAATPQDVAPPEVITVKSFSGNWCREHSCDSSSVYNTLAGNGVMLTGRETSCHSTGNATLDPLWRTLFTGNAGTSCSADRFLQGTAEDNSASSYGLESEIADVRITVVRTRDGKLIKEYHPFVRRGVFASWAVVLKIADYEDNEEYEWKVRATDAWGHAAEDSGTFTVTP